MDDLSSEIQDIGRLLQSASLLMSVRREVAAVMRDGFVVTDGRHHPSSGGAYEVVVRCGSSGDSVVRRLQGGIDGVDIERIADGVVGVRQSRRASDG